METVPPELAAQVREMTDDQGWLPPWPQWWGEEVMAELMEIRRRGGVRGRRASAAAGRSEEVHPPVPRWPDAPAAYLQLSEAYQGEAAAAAELGWPVAKRTSHHLAPLTDPAMVAESLRELIGHLGGVAALSPVRRPGGGLRGRADGRDGRGGMPARA